MKTSNKDLNNHYNQSRLNYDIKGESHLEYYKNKYPVYFKMLVEYNQHS